MTARATPADDGGLRFDFRLTGDPALLQLPERRPAAAVDGLWRHTCCEAFVMAGDGPGYREFNFSPSFCWAAYRFASYRKRDEGWLPPAAPIIEFARLPDGFALTATVPAALLPAGPLHAGLTAVIETADGEQTYWALAHAAQQPDFHLAGSFTLPIERP